MELLFDPPWYVFAVLLLAAVVLLYTGLGRQNRRLQAAGLVAAGLLVAVYVVGRVVETDREKVLRETNDLAVAVDRRDWPAFKRLLHPQVRFAIYGGRDQLTNGAEKTVERVGVKNISIGSLSALAEPGGYTVDFTATADIEAAGRRAPTNWRFHWEKSGDGFLLYSIEPLPSATFGTEPVTSRLVSP